MRIAIANDVPLAVEAISRVIRHTPGLQIAWVAAGGREAVDRCAADLPDLLLLDLLMPGMDGVEATRQIMAASPCAILIVTATVDGQAGRVFEALGAGALDVVGTPILGPAGTGAGVAALLGKIDVIARLLGRKGLQLPRAHLPPTRARTLVAIGASAGGPAALAAILGALPKDFPAAVVIVQHVDAQFAAQMAGWLHEQSALPVRVAIAGDEPLAGTVLLAGTNDHLIMTSQHKVGYTREPRSCSYRPSVDVFFESVLAEWPGEVLAVLLTGMGRDGATGLKSLREAGHFTLAQDQATSVVYGMPKAAAQLDAAVEILPLPEIAPRLARHFSNPAVPSR